jgi:hypothetical protein
LSGKKSIARNKARADTKNLTKDEKNKLKEDKKNKINEDKINKLAVVRNKKKEEKKDNLPKPNPKIKKDNDKYQYIDDISKNTEVKKIINEAVDNKNIVYIDPGKRSLMMMYNGDKYLDITNRWILKQTKRLKNNKIIMDRSKATVLDNGKTLEKINTELVNKRSKTMDNKKFNEYVKIKLELREQLKEEKKYNDLLQIKRWNGYVNRKRNMSIIVKKIKETFGENPKLVMGDWSNKGKIKYMSTPNMRLKKNLRIHFDLFLIDEFRTSMLHHKEETECDNLSISNISGEKKIDEINKSKKEVNFRLHSVLTYKMRSGYIGCINRDKNAVKNMKKITEEILKTGKRPAKYCREEKLEKKLKFPVKKPRVTKCDNRQNPKGGQVLQQQ